MPAALRRAYASTAAGQVHYRRATPDGPSRGAIVTGHWSPSTGRQYAAIAPLLAERGWTVFSPDYPGFGRSLSPPSDWRIPEFTANFGEFLDALGLERPILLGAHTTAAIAVSFANEHPGRVHRLILDGTPLWSAERRATMRAGVAFEITDDGSYLVELWTRLTARPGTVLERALAAAIDHIDARVSGAAASNALYSFDFADALTRIRVPTLILSATEDPLASAHGDAVALVVGAQGHVFQGRAPVLEPSKAAEYAAAVDAYLTT